MIQSKQKGGTIVTDNLKAAQAKALQRMERRKKLSKEEKIEAFRRTVGILPDRGQTAESIRSDRLK